MAISFGAITTADRVSASFWILGTPASSPGDILIVGLVATTDTTFTPQLAGWTLISKITCTDTGTTLHVFRRFVQDQEESQFTFNTSPNAAGVGFMASYSGVDDVNPIETDLGEQPPDINAACIDGGSPSQVVPGLVTTFANTVILTVIGTDGGANWTPDAGMTERADLNGNADLHFAEEAVAAVGATGTRTHVFSATTKYVALMLALRPIAAFAGPAFGAVATTANQGSATTWPVTTPTHSVGDLLLAGLFVNLDTVVVTPPAGWVLVKATVCTGLTSLHVFRKIAGASEPATQNFTMSPAVLGSHLMASYSGVDATTPLEASIGSQPPDINAGCIITPSHVVPGITTTVANVRAVTFVLGQLGIKWTVDPTTIERADVQSGGAVTDAHLADFGQEAVGATGTRTHNFSIGSQKYAAIMVGLKPPVPLLEALQSLPLESLATRENPFLLPMENRRGVSQNFQLPMDFLSSEELEVEFFLPMAAKQGVEKTIVLPLESTGGTPIDATQFIPVSALATLDAAIVLPVDSEGVVAGTVQTPIEFLEGVSAGQQIPVEFLGTIQIAAPCPLPIEALAAAGEGVPLPIEAGGLIIINATQSLPIEALALVVRQVLLPMEPGGLDTFSVIQTFNVFRRLSDPLLHEFIVVPSALLATIEHSFNVDNIIGGTIDHSFRVLPDLVPLFTVDIQRPFGKADKT